jgi:hypothetical protein
MRIITVFIAVVSGFVVLAGYFLTGFFPVLADVQTLLLNWAVILAGTAVFVGVFNLITVHTDKVRRHEKGSIYSAFLVIFLAVTFLLGLALRPEHTVMRVVVSGIIIPVEAMLMGLLTISLLYSAIRLLRRRADMMSVIFLIMAALIMIGSATLPFVNIPLLGTLSRWMTQVLALGGARGILIGVALGTLLTGLRVLFGIDRPYGGS